MRENIQMIKALDGAPPFAFQPIIKSISGCKYSLSPTASDEFAISFHSSKYFVFDMTNRHFEQVDKKPKQDKFISDSKQKLNHSMIERDSKAKTDKKQVNETTFLSQMSLDTPLRIARRPRSSTGFAGKNERGKKLLERFNKVFKELRAMDKSFAKKSLNKSKHKENEETGEMTKGDAKGMWSVCKGRSTHKEVQAHQHLKKHALREQVRPIVKCPPSKAFPKELAAINKLLLTENHKNGTKKKHQNSDSKDKKPSKSFYTVS